MGRPSPFHFWTYVISLLFKAQDQDGDFCMTMKWIDLGEKGRARFDKGNESLDEFFCGF